jgi:ABC-2 type transport system permease protein
MSTQANAKPDSPFGSQVTTPAVITATQRMYWSVRRELWEYRSIYLAPLVVAALLLFGFLIASLGRALSTANLDQRRAVLEEPSMFAAFLLMGTTFVVAVFYCLDALHGERRDRSILFWKSLPVSDLTTVLSKACIPILVLPLITFGITVVTQWIMMMLSGMVLLGSGMSISPLWARSSSLLMPLALLYHLVIIHGLWYSPFYGWLLLVSAWARRAAFLWAALPVVAIGIVEKLAFNTTHFVAMLGHRLGGGGEATSAAGGMAMDPMLKLAPLGVLISPGFWIGMAITAAFLAAAVRLRRYQGPI